MARTISYFLTSLLSFLFGVALDLSYRFGAELFSQDAGISSSGQLRASQFELCSEVLLVADETAFPIPQFQVGSPKPSRDR